MEILRFTINGNQEKLSGNPLGYHRTTQGSFWNKGSQKYSRWKEYVVGAFIRQYKEPKYAINMVGFGKPISLGDNKAYLNTMIYFGKGMRSDPDNVQKGIADALFINDRNVAGSYDFKQSEDNKGRVEVEVIINNDKN